MPQKKKLVVEFEATGMSWYHISYSAASDIFDYLAIWYEIWECES